MPLCPVVCRVEADRGYLERASPHQRCSLCSPLPVAHSKNLAGKRVESIIGPRCHIVVQDYFLLLY
jgi:hypothetical protein